MSIQPIIQIQKSIVNLLLFELRLDIYNSKVIKNTYKRKIWN